MSIRIIPCLDVRDGRVVKGKKFENIKDVDDPVVLAEFYSKAGADELVFYDITATNEGRKVSLEFIEKVAAKIDIPLCVGGGVSTIEGFSEIMEKGADKISINSAAVKTPGFIKEAATKYGSKAVVLGMDVKKIGTKEWRVFINGGRVDTGLDAVEWAMEAVRLGAGELVLNSIDTDGMKEGYDIELLKAVTDSVDVPVIASGGAGKMEDFSKAVLEGNADGVLAASVFHYKEIEIKDLKEYMRSKGIEVRL
ncbi:imidazole glycerol phosphate synthase subunit HisF [Tissierella creatinophila]|uniref:Imidazole glycerol phosphate synthase subunit HisF n=1 Tax=Tissierella creatinophila DSM 6911 TaxID=1123403 RepID=A0A1U7M7C5_TISCR|nr:imidazole glycerol phosphate synthase subunit HisF [Tissierella creatinophila]OLS03186.1 imidazole glycerol phosphate synthase subunit HisF [Tissierella creatinophila DSM 6911]